MMTLPPLSAISVMVEATRSMRVVSVTLPFSVGTLRSTRRSTRLPATSASSRVRNGLLMMLPSNRIGISRFCERRRRAPAGALVRRAMRRPSGQIVLASAMAVSAMRFEKPHSLSYQDRMRTNVPSMTLVWSMWKIDERASWLKSIETLGLSV